MRPRKKDRHLPACVYLRRRSYWYVKGGRWVRLGTDLTAALAAYSRLIGGPSGAMATLIDDALAHLSPKLAASTQAQYRIAANRLKEILAEFAPQQVTQRDVVQIKLALAHTPNMANRMLSFLRQVFDYALELELVDSNPCRDVKRLGEAKRGRYLTDDEYRAIYGNAGPRLQVIMDLLYLTAQRPIDVLRIRRADISEAGITFRQQKTGARLTVAWSPALRALVERAKTLHQNVRALTLLHNRRGKPPDYSTVKIQWDKARTAAGVPDAQLRDLRAKALTDAKRQGLDPQALAGHASPAMTERYIRLREIPVVVGPEFGRSETAVLARVSKTN